MYKNILVPVLFDAGHDTQAAFQIAQRLAGEGAKFTIVTVLEDIPSYASISIPDDVLKTSRQNIEQSLVAAAKTLPGAKPVLIHGHAGRAIVDYADKNSVDCIVIASHKLGLVDLFLGSTAANVVRHAKCSVHVIR